MDSVSVFWTIVSIPANRWKRTLQRNLLFPFHLRISYCFLTNASPHVEIEMTKFGDMCVAPFPHTGYDTVRKTLYHVEELVNRYSFYLFSDDDAFVDPIAILSDINLISRSLNGTNLLYGSVEWTSIHLAAGSMHHWGYSPSSASRSREGETKNRAALSLPFPFMKGPCYCIGNEALIGMKRYAQSSFDEFEKRATRLLVDVFWGYVASHVKTISLINMKKDLVEFRGLKRDFLSTGGVPSTLRALHMGKRSVSSYSAKFGMKPVLVYESHSRALMNRTRSLYTRLVCEDAYWHKKFYRKAFSRMKIDVGVDWKTCFLD